MLVLSQFLTLNDSSEMLNSIQVKELIMFCTIIFLITDIHFHVDVMHTGFYCVNDAMHYKLFPCLLCAASIDILTSIILLTLCIY